MSDIEYLLNLVIIYPHKLRILNKKKHTSGYGRRISSN